MAGRKRRLLRGWARRVAGIFREPRAINAAQFVADVTAAAAGLLAMVGGVPNLITGQIGPVLAVYVGGVLLVGGTVGAVSVLLGAWWLERISLLVIGLGWVLMLPACLSFAMTPGRSSAVWLVVALIMVALSDVFKRYRRLDWAYYVPPAR